MLNDIFDLFLYTGTMLGNECTLVRTRRWQRVDANFTTDLLPFDLSQNAERSEMPTGLLYQIVVVISITHTVITLHQPESIPTLILSIVIMLTKITLIE